MLHQVPIDQPSAFFQCENSVQDQTNGNAKLWLIRNNQKNNNDANQQDNQKNQGVKVPQQTHLDLAK